MFRDSKKGKKQKQQQQQQLNYKIAINRKLKVILNAFLRFQIK